VCGIIGCVGFDTAIPVLIKGLKSLEYRGYDSAGVAVLNGILNVYKGVGKIDFALKGIREADYVGSLGIGHTRWATHGSVSQANAHPHLDCNKTIAIVHNGIIENYRELRNGLSERGHVFSSETDSEIVAHLIEEAQDGCCDAPATSFEQACMRAFSALKGSFAILAICEGEEKLIAVRKSSPLVMGLTENGILFASDVSALLEWTKQVVYLQDNDVAISNGRDIRLYNLVEGDVAREVSTVEWDLEQAKKGEFEHFMLKEITEQADTVLRASQQNEEIIERIVADVKSAKGVFFVGCGSSYHACLAGSYIFSKVAGVHINLALGSEFENYEHFLTRDTLILAVSQSGETADVLDAVKIAKKNDSRVVGITNVMGSSLTREGDAFLLMNSGPEICVLSTKTYTSQVVLMSLLAHSLAGRREMYINNIRGLYLDIYNLTSRSMRDYLRELATLLFNKEHMYMIGRGLQYATALEAALKVKEVSYIHTEAFAGGELKHGPLALIERGTPVFVFAGNDNRGKILSNSQEVKARGGFVIGISAQNDDVFDYWIKVPECGDCNPIIQAIPMQILAYELAVLRGLDPDKPRNLAKCVTVL
jgi:glucosamine--fructose-6-phosphate aminotransferase (isomerizing)